MHTNLVHRVAFSKHLNFEKFPRNSSKSGFFNFLWTFLISHLSHVLFLKCIEMVKCYIIKMAPSLLIFLRKNTIIFTKKHQNHQTSLNFLTFDLTAATLVHQQSKINEWNFKTERRKHDFSLFPKVRLLIYFFHR